MIHLKYIKEYLQQADKEYFKNNLLTTEDRENILSITNGDSYTKLVTDMYFYKKINLDKNIFDFKKETNQYFFKTFYRYIKEYDKNIFPIICGKGYNITDYNGNIYDIYDLYIILSHRDSAVNELNKLPSLAKRNLKDVRNTTTNKDFEKKEEFLRKIYYRLEQLEDENLQKAINKGLKKGNTIEQAYEIIDSIYHSFNSKINWDFDIDEVLYWIEQENCKIVQKDDNVVVLKIYDFETMRDAFGEITNWCFTYAKTDFYQYASDGCICLIINLKKDPKDAEYILFYDINNDRVWVSTDVQLNRLDGYSDTDSKKYLRSIGVDLSKIPIYLQ